MRRFPPPEKITLYISSHTTHEHKKMASVTVAPDLRPRVCALPPLFGTKKLQFMPRYNTRKETPPILLSANEFTNMIMPVWGSGHTQYCELLTEDTPIKVFLDFDLKLPVGSPAPTESEKAAILTRLLGDVTTAMTKLDEDFSPNQIAVAQRHGVVGGVTRSQHKVGSKREKKNYQQTYKLYINIIPNSCQTPLALF